MLGGVMSAMTFRVTQWHAWGAALVLGVGIGLLVVLLTRHGTPAAQTAPPLHAATTWPAGAKPAPGFRLLDEKGSPISLGAFRGRNVLVTFIDPVCRDLCPLEAQTLMTAVRGLPTAQRPAILAVSVNPWADTASNFRLDATHWHLGAAWHWAVGTQAQLARVWRAYHIGWQAQTKRIAGVTVHQIAHTEGSYLVDASGYERALFLAPYGANDVLATIRSLD
jgi:cytochrome oxidase Cu insertion factor (SCO1/SenC/PrrC family)